jgi:hypothetical protein
MMLGGHEMPEITVTALDSATAMEEVVKRLGMDALIVSTRRVGSQIEIVATNEEMVSGKTQDQPKQKKSNTNANFSELLKSKLANVTDETSSDIAPPRNKHEVIKTIRDELRLLEDIMDEPSENKPNSNTVLDAFRLAGLSKRVKSHLPDLDATISTTDLSKMIAKKFVRGQSDEFDNSDIYFVVGLEKSGKSTFVEKLRKFFETQNPDLSVQIFKNVTGASDYKNVADWFSKKIKSARKQPVRVIVEVNALEQLETQLYKFQQQNPSLAFSVINVIEVGRSYDFLLKNIRTPNLENEYSVISKLDACDITLPEVSALIELGHKCSFFSGIVQSDEGLYYSRVDQVAAHLTALVEKQKDS